MVVLTLVPRVDISLTIDVLESLLAKARRGEISGLALCFRCRGEERSVYTGVYRASPAEAVRAGLRMSLALNQALDAPLPP